MISAKTLSRSASDRKAIDRRVRRMYAWLNRGLADKCFSLLDPQLAKTGRVDPHQYAEGLRAFKEDYGSVRPWHIRISVHLDGSTCKFDPRPFAYVYVTWQDETHGFHMFRERWVKHDGVWYSQVAGLVPNGRKKA